MTNIESMVDLLQYINKKEEAYQRKVREVIASMERIADEHYKSMEAGKLSTINYFKQIVDEVKENFHCNDQH